MRLLKTKLYCSDIKLANSLFTFLFDCESQIVNDHIEVDFKGLCRFILVERVNRDNYFLFKAESESLDDIKSKIELFNYQNSSNIQYKTIDNRLDVLLSGSVIVSFI